VLNHARWIAARRLPKKFSEKFEVSSDKTINVFINRSTPQQVVIEGQTTETAQADVSEIKALDDTSRSLPGSGKS
jgi:hypothetical protein